MPLNLASPGIVIREVDLTSGRVDPTSNKIGAIVAPFARGPVDEPTLITNEKELLENFGNPYPIDKHYEEWLVASSYLAYGGSLRVVRCDNSNFKNAFVGSALTATKIKSYEDYINLGYDENTISGITFAAKNPGSWANGIKVAIIDGKADQILSGISTSTFVNFSESISNRLGTIATTGISTVAITTASISPGQVVVCDTSGVLAAGTTVISVGTGLITLSNSFTGITGITTTTFDFGTNVTKSAIVVGCGITQAISSTLAGSGSTSVLDGYLKGVVTGIVNNGILVKVVSQVSSAGVETPVDYQPNGVYAFSSSGSLGVTTTGLTTAYGTASYTARQDWFDQQTISLTSGSISWNNLASRPGTSGYASARNSKYDQVHVVVIDDTGSITGNAGTILEKHIGLSKATDAEFSAGSSSYWRKYLAENSAYIFAGGAPSGITTTSFISGGFALESDIGWDQEASGARFAAAGSVTYTLAGGLNYGGSIGLNTSGSLTASLSDLSSGYALFENTEQYKVDFLLMGSAAYTKEISQALASKLISVAELRKDAIAFISPYRSGLLTESSTDSYTLKDAATITDNILGFYASVPSSSYAVFDSGYKYMYDRFSNTFRYVPLNGDIAGLCARNDTVNFPWFSPAGTSRGAILNAVKLAYNPSKAQRDRLYSERINPVIFSPGSGIVLFGDKTGLARASAFDRINVRRLFIYLENAISAAAKDVMFEFNDETTRSGFVNTVEPFLRDIQAKRGIIDYRIICNTTNNTAAIIDANEFVADIYIKPNRSINYIGLTFVATSTGVAFEEIIGNV